MNETTPYPVSSLKFWAAYIIQMRPYLLFVSGIAGALGIAMSASAATPAWKIIAAFIPFFLGYGFGQALTDCFQTDTDKLSAPYRPLSKGSITIRSVLVVSLTGLTLSGVLLFLLHPLSLVLCLLSIFGLATYSYIKKNCWYGGPFYNAWIVALLPVMGYIAVLHSSLINFPVVLYSSVPVTFFSYANFVLIGYLKDIEADKATGYKTFPVVFGWNKTMLLGDFFALITLLFYWYNADKNWYEIIAGSAATAILLTGQIKGHLSKTTNEKAALIPILCTVRGFILLHIAVILRYQPSCWPILLLYYILFETALYLRPSKYQV